MVAAAFNAFQTLWLRQVTNNKRLSLVIINHPLPKKPKAIVSIKSIFFQLFYYILL